MGFARWRLLLNARYGITAPKTTIKKIDFSHLESPDRTNEYKAGFGEFSPASFEAIYDPANASQGQVLTDGTSGQQRNWRLILRNTPTIDGRSRRCLRRLSLPNWKRRSVHSPFR